MVLRHIYVGYGINDNLTIGTIFVLTSFEMFNVWLIPWTVSNRERWR